MKTQDKKYITLVFQAKALIADLEDIRMQVADLALEACTIKLGGHLSGFYSVKNFADDIGLSRKTLCGWTQARRVQITLKESNKQDVTSLAQINKIRDVIRRTPSEAQDHIHKYKDINKIKAAINVIKNPDDKALNWETKKISQVKAFLRDHQINKMDTNKILAMRKLLNECINIIDQKSGPRCLSGISKSNETEYHAH